MRGRAAPPPPRRLLLAPLLAALAGACLFGGEEEGPEEPLPGAGSDNLPVVDDVGPFDPAEAVDDDDEALVELGQADDTTDQDPYADEPTPAEDPANQGGGQDEQDRGAPDARRADASREGDGEPRARAAAAHERDAAGQPVDEGAGEPPRARADEDEAIGSVGPVDPAENERAQGKEAEALEGEDVAGPREVAALEERRRLAHEQAQAGDDRAAKAELASNPPAEEPGELESTAWTLVDLLAEGLLVGLLAGGVTLLVLFSRSHPRIVGAVALALLLAGAYLWMQSA